MSDVNEMAGKLQEEVRKLQLLIWGLRNDHKIRALAHYLQMGPNASVDDLLFKIDEELRKRV